MINVMTGRPRESGAQEPQRRCPVGRPRPASSATVPRHWPLAIGHSLVIGYWPLVIGRQGGSINVNGRDPGPRDGTFVLTLQSDFCPLLKVLSRAHVSIPTLDVRRHPLALHRISAGTAESKGGA